MGASSSDMSETRQGHFFTAKILVEEERQKFLLKRALVNIQIWSTSTVVETTNVSTSESSG